MEVFISAANAKLESSHPDGLVYMRISVYVNIPVCQHSAEYTIFRDWTISCRRITTNNTCIGYLMLQSISISNWTSFYFRNRTLIISSSLHTMCPCERLLLNFQKLKDCNAVIKCTYGCKHQPLARFQCPHIEDICELKSFSRGMQ